MPTPDTTPPAPHSSPSPTHAPSHADTPSESQSVLLALASDDLAGPAVRFTEALAAHWKIHPELFHVMELALAVLPDGMIGATEAFMTAELLEAERRQQNEAALRKTFHAAAGLPATWPLRIELGNAASCILERARVLDASLIVLGLRRHNRMEQALGNDILREVVTHGDIPVLALRPQLTHLPRSVIVAVDFSRASLRAAHLARSLMDPAGTMRLVFVEPPVSETHSEREHGRRHIETVGIDAALHKLVTDLNPAPGMTINYHRGIGDVMAELKLACEHFRPDLLALGRQHHDMIERLRIGSVTAAMVRDARWSLLITPPVE